MRAMATAESDDLLPTRASLLARLKDAAADDSWREFFDLYWKLLYNAARRHGLGEFEAQDVIQEIMVELTRTLKTFNYDPQRGSFKAWLRRETYWRVTDHLRSTRKFEPLESAGDIPAECDFTEFWEKEWADNLVSAAIDRAKLKLRPRQFQMYSYCVLQKHGPRKTAVVFHASSPQIYLNNHRVSRVIESEIKKLRAEIEH